MFQIIISNLLLLFQDSFWLFQDIKSTFQDNILKQRETTILLFQDVKS